MKPFDSGGRTMNRTIRSIFVIAVLCAATGSANAVEPGIYYCVTERLVGIQPSRELKDDEDWKSVSRTWGKIKPSKEKFIVKIVELDRKERNQLCDLENFHRGYAQANVYCSDLPLMEARLPGEKRGGGGGGLGYLSTGKNVFSTGLDLFWIIKSLHYKLTQFRSGAAYLEEGYCETFE